MEKPKTVKQYKQHFYEQGIDPLMIKELYGDLRLRSTWAQAYDDITEYNELPIIKAIADSPQDVEQPKNFVPPAPPTIPPAPPTTQPLLPPAKEYPALPPAREPIERPGDGRRDNLELQRLPYYHSQLLIAVIAAPVIFPDHPFISDEPAVILDESAREVAPKTWVYKGGSIKRQHTCLLRTPILLFGKPKYRSPESRILNTIRPPPF
ncbi:MAG: hypothetical protein F6K48_14305 [Okeania sp. SIO3H1]|uniref:hypothetical protein n=1 Tax=Okeania sp. SIO1I7 TaxID=2607772 RepID=UPI0013CBF13C|nr:hypothetical protein [Okeania sp. SIO1I7]NEN90018.1 hypothetical protein [Okeania sp. SIO3H1]NET24967.1 hypothetical protein [Okeania sp. SIO1I7]